MYAIVNWALGLERRRLSFRLMIDVDSHFVFADQLDGELSWPRVIIEIDFDAGNLGRIRQAESQRGVEYPGQTPNKTAGLQDVTIVVHRSSDRSQILSRIYYHWRMA